METEDVATATTTATKRRLDNVLYYVAAFFMPSILLFNLYNQNRVENHIVFTHVFILSGVLAVIGVFVFWGFKIISGGAEGALLLSISFWVCFWLFESLLSVALRYAPALPPTNFMILLGIGLVLLALLIRRYDPPFTEIRPVFNTLALILFALFIFNLYPGVNHEMILRSARAEMALVEEGEEPFYMKRTFHIDPTLPTPDIYWIHLDGMMSLETVERFWGESQEHLRDELSSRGFVIYENALLNAGYTHAALPALLSPAFYDSFWGERLAQVETELKTPRVRLLGNELAQAGLTYADDLLPNHELLVALSLRGYEIVIRGLDGLMPHSFEHLTGIYSNFMMGFLATVFSDTGDLPELLNLTTPLNIPPTSEQFVESRQSNNEEDYESILPLFDWLSLFNTHMFNVWQHDPDIAEVDIAAVHVYPLAYAQIAERMLYFADRTIAQNPNAIIILQSDHGFHYDETQQHMLDQGYSLEQVLELIHSVFSAVRIPPEYGGLDAPINPLNISRELVNRFVGENYTLLP